MTRPRSKPTKARIVKASRADVERLKRDGWANILTGLGMSTRDKRATDEYAVETIDRTEAEDLWRGDDMAARIVELIPGEMMRGGLEIHVSEDDADRGKAIEEATIARLEELLHHERIVEALCYERAYGGAGILVGADDGAVDLSLPLDEGALRAVSWLTTLTPRELQPVTWYTDPRAPRFGEPATYRITPETTSTSSQIVVHESRLLLFRGIKVSRAQTVALNGWGDSVLTRCRRVLADYQQSWASAAILLHDFAQAVLKIKDLAELVATNNDTVVLTRARLLDMSRSVARMILLDSEEEFERKATPITGLPEMLEKFSLRLAAAADMPVTLLMGQAPAGLNATGASDIRFFYDRIAARQQTHLRPAVEKLVRLLFRAKDGPTGGQEPAVWSVTFPSLWQATDKEIAEERKLVAETDAIYINAGVLAAEEVAASRFGGDEWSAETSIDLEARARLAATVKPEKPTPTTEERGEGEGE